MNKILLSLMVLVVGVFSSLATEGYDDLAKLVKAKANDDVILAFIDVSNVSYAFTADEIIQMKDMGASSKVIAAAIRHKKPNPEPEVQRAVAASAPPTNVTYTGQPPIVVSPDNEDNYVVYESLPPSVDYYYYPYSTDCTFYPVWQPYYSYHGNHGRARGYSGGGGWHGSGHGGGQGWHGGSVSYSSYKQGSGGVQKAKR